MKATLVTRFRDVTPEGDIIELVVWRVPEPVPPGDHAFKYRLAFIVEGHRVVGFDNERGKGDHCHVGDKDHPYAFRDVDQLFEDFIAEVEKWRNEG